VLATGADEPVRATVTTAAKSDVKHAIEVVRFMDPSLVIDEWN